mgnify:FL=1
MDEDIIKLQIESQTYTSMHTYIHTYIHAHTHAYMHTYIHILKENQKREGCVDQTTGISNEDSMLSCVWCHRH